MLVTQRIILKNKFITFVNQLKEQQQLNQTMVDECHIILNKLKNFRLICKNWSN